MEADIEPIRHALTARVGYLKMYREDVDQLLEMFQQACDKVTISDQKHRYKTLDAMKRTVSSPLKELSIRGENPDVLFLFNRIEVFSGSNPPTQNVFNELRTETSTDASDALFYKIKDFLIAHQQPGFRKVFIVGAFISLVGVFWFLRHAVANQAGQMTVPADAVPGFFA